MLYQLLTRLDEKFGFERAKAHCDIPCGIYDPSAAQIAALTVIRMIDLMSDLAAKGGQDLAAMNSMARYIASKEEHAEKAKHEVRVIWGDYIKPDHISKYPELPELAHKIMMLGSKARQTVDRQQALDLLNAINQFAEIFWATKGVATKRAKAPYLPG